MGQVRVNNDVGVPGSKSLAETVRTAIGAIGDDKRIQLGIAPVRGERPNEERGSEQQLPARTSK